MNLSRVSNQPKTVFNRARAGLNRETLDTFLSGTIHM